MKVNLESQDQIKRSHFASPRTGGGPLSEYPRPPPGGPPPRLGSPFLENSTRQGEAAAGGW